jgi:hypothetical protein
MKTGGPLGGEVASLASSGAYLFAGIPGGGVYRSSDNGASWSEASVGLTNLNVHTLAASGTTLFAGTLTTMIDPSDNDTYRSTDNGASWMKLNTSFTLLSLAVKGTDLFAGTAGQGIYRSTDNGASWVQINTGLLKDNRIYAPAIAVIGTDIIAEVFFNGIVSGFYGDRLYRSTDNGNSFLRSNRQVCSRACSHRHRYLCRNQ